jgi:hypothetical protein
VRVRHVSAFLLAATLVAALPAAAREILTPEEQAERELAKRREAEPVLVCEPTALEVAVKRGETRALRVTIRNAGGLTLSWAVISAPKWVSPDRRAGELGFDEKRSLVLTVDPEGLGGVETTGEIVIEAPEAEGSPVTVRIVAVVEGGIETESDIPAPEVTEPRTPPKPDRPAPRGPRSRRFGVRAGYLMPNSGQLRRFDAGPLVGPYLHLARRNGSRLTVELGLDVYRLQSDDEFWVGHSDVFAGRLDVLYALAGPAARTGGYVVCGIAGLLESAVREGVDIRYVNGVGALDLGAGASMASGRLDLRLTHNIVLGGENVGALTSVTMAVGF